MRAELDVGSNKKAGILDLDSGLLESGVRFCPTQDDNAHLSPQYLFMVSSKYRSISNLISVPHTYTHTKPPPPARFGDITMIQKKIDDIGYNTHPRLFCCCCCRRRPPCHLKH